MIGCNYSTQSRRVAESQSRRDAEGAGGAGAALPQATVPSEPDLFDDCRSGSHKRRIPSVSPQKTGSLRDRLSWCAVLCGPRASAAPALGSKLLQLPGNPSYSTLSAKSSSASPCSATNADASKLTVP